MTELVILENEEYNYKLIRGEFASDADVKVVQGLFRRFREDFVVYPNIEDDWKRDDEEYPEDGCEIILGVTAHPKMQEILSTINYGEYKISVVGKRIYVAAWDSESLQAAIDVFYNSLEISEDGKKVSVPVTLSAEGKANGIINSVPGFEGGRFLGLFPTGDDCYMILLDRTKESEYSSYLGKLESAGYTNYTKREAADNIYATYTGNGQVVNVYYTDYYGQTRITIEPEANTTLPLRAEDAVSAPVVCESSINMVGLGYVEAGTMNNIGLFMVYTLPDGRLIVIDGGYYAYDTRDCLELFTDALKKCAPDPENITIAAWVLTHAHPDHAGALYNYCNNGVKKYKYITVESFIYNFTTPEQYALIKDDGYAAEIREKVPAAFPNAKITKAHTGQVFHFGNDVSLEVLYTIEDHFPDDLDYHNTASLVTRLNIGDVSVIALGDATHATGRIMVNSYGTYLKSNIVQLSHHGVGGITSNTYTNIAGEILLWPSTSTYAGDVYTDSYNAEAIKWAKDVYIADTGITTIKLPYTIQNNKDSVIGKIQ